MASQGGFYGTGQASPFLSSNTKQLKSEKSSLSGSFESPKSYGSTTKPVRSEVDIKIVGHVVEHMDTLQGLSIRYGVPVEDIRRVNKLWTNDNIHFYKIIKIPVKITSQFVDLDELDVDVEQEKHESTDNIQSDSKEKETPIANSSVTKPDNSVESVSSFLQKLDITIKQNVKQSKKLRLQSEKYLLETMEREQHASSNREDELFRPLSSFSSTSHRPSGRFVNRSKSDMLNSDEQFFEL